MNYGHLLTFCNDNINNLCKLLMLNFISKLKYKKNKRSD